MNVKTKIQFTPYEGKEPFLFISYSHADTEQVYKVLNRLYKEKFRIWFDETMEIGEDFREELRARIEQCTAFVLFVSNASMQSKFCGMEIITAYKLNKRIYPIYIDEDVTVPSVLSMILDNLQHVNGLNVDTEDKYIKKLIDSLPIETMRSLDIADGVLSKCKDGSKVIRIPDCVEVIEYAAFKECEKLEEIIIPENTFSIKDEAFRGCKNIGSVHLKQQLQYVGESAFRDCISMKALTIENGDIEIGERAFENCRELEEITLPNDLKEIYGGVFNSCKSIQHICLPEELTIIGESAFADCISLEEITIPPNVSKLDDMAFNGCIGLCRVNMNSKLGKIGKNCFKDCKNLVNFFIPLSVYMIGTSPFRGCDSLESISVDPKNKYFKSVDDVLFNKNRSVLICYPAKKDKYEYEIPDSVTVVSDWAFCECEKLNKIIIPDSVSEIGEGAFYKCKGLKHLELPDSVERIDDTAFRGCSELESIVIPSSVVEFGWGMFNGCEKVTVICDDDSRAAEYCEKRRIKHQPFQA